MYQIGNCFLYGREGVCTITDIVTRKIKGEERIMAVLLVLVIVSALLALGYAAFNYVGVKKLDEGTERMSEIAEAIRVGANAFVTYEYKIIAVVVAVIAVIFGVIFNMKFFHL